VISAISATSEVGSDALKLLAHLLLAEKIWLLRLKGIDTTEMNVFSELTLSSCEELAEENHIGYTEFISSLSEEVLDRVVTYKNLSGKEFRTPLKEILLHVALHGTYHRGQIASALRGAGHTPVNTDFITFVRET
jgi:uncharacterized damage-inducible protein DinB